MDEVMQVITAAERSTKALSDCTTRFPNTAMAFKMIQSAKGMMELEYHNRGSGYFRVHCWTCKQATEPLYFKGSGCMAREEVVRVFCDIFNIPDQAHSPV